MVNPPDPNDFVVVTTVISKLELETKDPKELRKDLGELTYATALRKLPPAEKPGWVEVLEKAAEEAA